MKKKEQSFLVSLEKLDLCQDQPTVQYGNNGLKPLNEPVFINKPPPTTHKSGPDIARPAKAS